MIFPGRTPSFGAVSLNVDHFMAIVRAGISALQTEEESA
jgi:hypothetical protein